MDEEMISAAIDFSTALSVAIDFDHYLNHLGPETADLDVRSSLTGGEWINVRTVGHRHAEPGPCVDRHHGRGGGRR